MTRIVMCRERHFHHSQNRPQCMHPHQDCSCVPGRVKRGVALHILWKNGAQDCMQVIVLSVPTAPQASMLRTLYCTQHRRTLTTSCVRARRLWTGSPLAHARATASAASRGLTDDSSSSHRNSARIRLRQS